MKHPCAYNTVEAAPEPQASQDVPAITLERLGPADVEALSSLEQQCFTCPWTASQYAQLLGESSLVVVGAKAGKHLLGYSSLYHAVDTLEILNLATAPQFRRQGLARRILAFVLRIGEQMGIQQVVLEVRVHNVAARRLYESMGFVQAGVRKQYYPDTGEDALVLIRQLPRENTDHRGSL